MAAEKTTGGRTRPTVSIVIPRRLLDLLDAERKPGESRSVQIARHIMDSMKLTDEERKAIYQHE